MNLYFDNGTTSYPKSPAVASAVALYIAQNGASYARGFSARSIDVLYTVDSCRKAVAVELGVADYGNVFFTSGATAAACEVIFSIAQSGDRVLVSPMEHNAVIRPLQAAGAAWEVLPHNDNGAVDIDKLSAVDTDGVKLVVINHASNINGVVQNIGALTAWAHSFGAAIAVDTAQSGGCIPIAGDKWGADYIIFSAHKGFGGIGGLGGLYARNPDTVVPRIFGGTGINSGSFDMPAAYPERLEAGTHNVAGIAALLSALENPLPKGHSDADFENLLGEIDSIKNLTLYSGGSGGVELFSVVSSNMDCAALGQKLYNDFGIETRCGLHCAPLAHRSLGTFSSGAVRISPSKSHTAADFGVLVKALISICS